MPGERHTHARTFTGPGKPGEGCARAQVLGPGMPRGMQNLHLWNKDRWEGAVHSGAESSWSTSTGPGHSRSVAANGQRQRHFPGFPKDCQHVVANWDLTLVVRSQVGECILPPCSQHLSPLFLSL